MPDMKDSPGMDGTTVDQIKTPMTSKNVGKDNTPGTHDFSNTFNKGSGGSSSIEGPGKKGAWPKS